MHGALTKEWISPDICISPAKMSKDLLRKSVDFCLNMAKKCENEDNFDEAESLFLYALSMDGSNAGNRKIDRI